MLRLAALLPLLAACEQFPLGQTHAQIDTQFCGSPVQLTLADGKDRQTFTVEVICSDGTKINIQSTESTTKAIETLPEVLQPIEAVIDFATKLGKPL